MWIPDVFHYIFWSVLCPFITFMVVCIGTLIMCVCIYFVGIKKCAASLPMLTPGMAYARPTSPLDCTLLRSSNHSSDSDFY